MASSVSRRSPSSPRPPTLGPFGAPVAFTIAATKALLVMLFFMHLKDSPGIVWLAAIGGFFWLGILIVLTMSDVATRGVLPIPGK
ncbi:MAG: hypothetical protein E6J79_03995 [Deltaproteobacteria bacterium]|nr:MAG: hypothetical protein E6J79_03995 [Deltaproteobacteria bacterium]